MKELRNFIESIKHNDAYTVDLLLEAIDAITESETMLISDADMNGQSEDETPTNSVDTTTELPRNVKVSIDGLGNMNDRDVYAPLIVNTANKYGVDPALAMAIVHKESSFNPNAKSGVGAIGLMQLMPPTASDLDVDPTVPEENIDGGIRYISQLIKRFGSEEMALAAYNSGPGNISKARRIAGSNDWDIVKNNLVTSERNQLETLDYVPKIMKFKNTIYKDIGNA